VVAPTAVQVAAPDEKAWYAQTWVMLLAGFGVIMLLLFLLLLVIGLA